MTTLPLMVNEATRPVREECTFDVLHDVCEWLTGKPNKAPSPFLAAKLAGLIRKMRGTICALSTGSFVLYKGQDDKNIYIIPLGNEKDKVLIEVSAEVLANPTKLADNLHKAVMIKPERLAAIMNMGVDLHNVVQFTPSRSREPRYEA